MRCRVNVLNNNKNMIMNMKYGLSQQFREERDSFGPILVPSDRLWAAQTQRSLENFRIGSEGDRMPYQLIKALAIIKKSMAKVNVQFGLD